MYATFQAIAYTSLIVVVYATLFEDDEDDEGVGEEEREAKPEVGNESNEAREEDTIFIPLGFAYKLPQKFYKGTDPEWQSFVQLSQNRKLCGFLRSEQFTNQVRFQKLILQQINLLEWSASWWDLCLYFRTS